MVYVCMYTLASLSGHVDGEGLETIFWQDSTNTLIKSKVQDPASHRIK